MNKYIKSHFEPDGGRVEKAARNEWTGYVPLYEHLVGANMIYEITGNRPYDMYASDDPAESGEGYAQYWNYWKSLGYDSSSMEFGFNGILPGSGALGNHIKGVIGDRGDFERYPWGELTDMYYEKHTPHIKRFLEARPAGMGAVGGVGNGVFEAVQDLVGYVDLCYMRGDDEELYADMFNAVGDAMYRVWDRFLNEYAGEFCVFRFGDDLGFKNQTLISPDDIRRRVVPHYKRIIDRVHSCGKPFLLHSCGNLTEVMDDLIGTAGIDAKHSNEDQIMSFVDMAKTYGGRIGNFGGIDVDPLCNLDEKGVKEYVRDQLDGVKGMGGIAYGSGNSIPDYIPPANYLAMIEAVREWRGDAVR